MLKSIDKNIWVAQKSLKYWQLEVGTRMTIIRYDEGKLMVISPIPVDTETINQINEIAQVNLIIAPNLFHHLFITDFQAIYPQAQLWGVYGLESKRLDLSIDKIIDEREGNIGNSIEYLLFEGFEVFDLNRISILNEIVFFHIESKTLILTDTAFYFDESFPWQTQLVARLIQTYKNLAPSIIDRLVIRNKDLLKQSIQKILAWDFTRVIVAHGSIVETNAKEKLQAGYKWLLS